MLDKFVKFFVGIEDCPLSSRSDLEEYITTFTCSIGHQLLRAYYDLEDETKGSLLRPSCIGKHYDFDILLSTLNGESLRKPIDEKLQLTFLLGYFYEAWVGMTLKRLGYNVKEQVDAVDTWTSIKGSIDYVITDDSGQDIILEVKSSSDYYFNKVLESGMSDDRGYITQLCLYQEFSGIPAYWLFINKSDLKMLILPLNEVVPESIRKHKIARARQLALDAPLVKGVDDIWRMVRVPPPSIEMDRLGNYIKEDGKLKLYIPSNALAPNVYYETYEGKTRYGKKRTYVSGFKYDRVKVNLEEYAVQSHKVRLEEEALLRQAMEEWKLDLE